MSNYLRVAYFPDSFLEFDGVAMTSNKLVKFARERDLPFLCIHAGPKTETREDGSIRFVTLKRSPLSIPLDHSLRYDPFFQRHLNRVKREIQDFKPDVIHITGPNDVSIIGAWLAWKLDIPLVGSWHTNVHEYAARRLKKSLWFMPEGASQGFTKFIERQVRTGAKLYYMMPTVLLAPNQEIVEMLRSGTTRPSKLMVRGVDTDIFSPDKRTINDSIIRFGFVGRLRAEKNVRLLVELEKKLLESGRKNFRFLIVGEGDERKFLEANMKTADFTGFLEGERLSEAYANMDVFVFPSDTDAFGNVPQEAMASGSPAIVSDKGGPKFFVTDGYNGYVASNLDDFVKYAQLFIDDPELLAKMKVNSIEFAQTRTWESVFETVYEAYNEAKEYMDRIRKEQPNRKKRVLKFLRKSPATKS
ncbi:MAG TPA: glycosyltransferase [Pyrinomonadaceae bacterium]|jgi:phosphatidylinositol alpha 1,6-mannosyltransferase|nr:glycosyltransferase [Pyrinomonadaceae bacterium]